MTGAEALAFAAARGVRVTFSRGDLQLEADREPSVETLVVLREHKEAVIAELRKSAAKASEQRQVFDRRVRTVMHLRGLPR